VNRLLGREARDERGAARRTNFDDENLRDVGIAARDAADHALAQTGIETVAEQHEIRDARRLHRDDVERALRGRSARRERRGGDEREEAGLEETTEHRKICGAET